MSTEPEMNQSDRDKAELGWQAAWELWLENREDRTGFLSRAEAVARRADDEEEIK